MRLADRNLVRLGPEWRGPLSEDTARRRICVTRFCLIWSDAAQKIDFSNGIRLDEAGLYEVYKVLIVNYMHVAIDHTMDPDMAKYSDADNTFYFSKSTFANRDSTMIDLSFNKPADWFTVRAPGTLQSRWPY